MSKGDIGFCSLSMGWRLHIGRPLFPLRGQRASKSLPALSESFSERIPSHLGLAEKKKVMNLKVFQKVSDFGNFIAASNNG